GTRKRACRCSGKETQSTEGSDRRRQPVGSRRQGRQRSHAAAGEIEDAPRRGARRVARCGAQRATRLVNQSNETWHPEGCQEEGLSDSGPGVSLAQPLANLLAP